jgi:hypothetical protein
MENKDFEIKDKKNEFGEEKFPDPNLFIGKDGKRYASYKEMREADVRYSGVDEHPKEKPEK